MSLKNASLFALFGMTLLSVLLAVGFIRDFSGVLSGVVPAMGMVKSGIHLLAGVSVALFFYVFYRSGS